MTCNISMVRGASKTLRITLTDAAGQPYILTTGELLRFGVKCFYEDTQYVMIKTLTSADLDDGAYVLHILPTDTLGLKCNRYYYDIGLQTGSNYYPVVECSEFELTHNITKYTSA